MSTTYGLSAVGFQSKQQQTIKSEIEASLKAVFGQNINLSSQSNFGQFVAIMSERETLIWQLAEAVYNSQYPGGAEGTSVDNILSLNNLKRLPAAPTRTNPISITQSNGIKQYGLILYGTPGTTIPAGSIVKTTDSPAIQFSTDAAVTIAAAVNAVQSLFLSNTPNSGAFSLSIVGPSGNTLNTGSMPYNILAQISKVNFSSVPVAGSYSLSLTVGSSSANTPSIPYNASAAQVQTAIQSVSGYGSVTVSGSVSAGFQVNFGSIQNPILGIHTNSTSVTISFQNSLQAIFNNMNDSSTYPFVDVVVSTGASGFNFTFNGSSGSQPQPLILLVSNSMQFNTTVTNVSIVNSVDGAKAQAIATATCTVTGPNFVGAESISVIGTSLSGWTGVENQLDCITGSNKESDTDALLRRISNLQAQANGPLQSIIEKVRTVANVTTAIGFENLNEAALQRITFPIAPTSGKYNLVLNGVISPDIQWNDDAAQIQTKLATTPGLADIQVSGNVTSGYLVDFNGDLGGQPLPLMVVTGNTTGGSVVVLFDRPGKSFEIVVNGGDDNTIATTILNSKPAGIKSYGTTDVLTFDPDGNQHHIEFSRPVQVPIYVVINMTTDYFTSANKKFNPSSIQTIQQDIVKLGNAVGIGGLIVAKGSNGLIGAFNDVPGIINYDLFFGQSPNPSSSSNIQLQPEEVPVFETFNVSVSYT